MIYLKTVKQKLQEQRDNEYKLSDADYEDFINSGRSLTEYMAEAENRMIEEAIAASGGNMVRAAEMLKVSPKTLKNRQR
ncbi:MAG: helix-turn-helix domain-containing protein [Anaerovoracaceae bacterium]